MKLKYILGTALLGSLSFSSCMEDFSDVNTDPSIITTPDIRYLFTQGLNDFIPSDYWSWYYDFTNMLHWGQVTVSGNTNLLNQPANSSGIGNVVRILKVMREIDYQVESMTDPVMAAQYKHIQSMMKTLVVFMGIQDTDMYGSMPYSEAAMARYTTPALLTPKYDTQEELFTSFDEDLKNAFEVLSNPVVVDGNNVSQMSLGYQDYVYQGDSKKWATFCNSLRLKVAVRLLHVNKEKALQIANEVASHSEYLLTSNGDNCSNNFVYNQGSEWYHSQEDPAPGYGTKVLVDFMVENKDPRVRFFFAKNDLNSKVVQAFFDSEAELGEKCESKIPSFIMDKINYEVVDGRKVFKGWKAPGEPWVRYYGMPLTINASSDSEYEDYYDPTGKLHKVKLNNTELSYAVASAMQMEMYEGNRDYTYPDAPGAEIVQDKTDRPFYAMYFSAGEVNLYLAELKLIGANLPQSAQTYFNDGIKNSVEAWDYIAGANHIPYYDTPFDSNEATIDLKDGEVDALLTKEAYQLNGVDDLEKVYIQQRLNFIFMPNDMYVSMRRSGVPTKDSKYLKFENFRKDGSDYILPRRFPMFAGNPTDLNYNNYEQALKDQGFTIGSGAENLNSERVWYDKGAPEFGAGPNF